MTKNGEVRLFPKHAAKDPAQFRTWTTSISDTFKEYLEGKGLNLTHQREEVLKCLLSAGNHMSLDDVYIATKKRDSTIGRATVFRTLKLLEECGLAAEVGSADGRTRFEIKADRPHHDHMICIECGRITEFESPMMERFQNEAVRKHKFTAFWHRHEIFGRCQACNQRRTVEA